MRSSDARQAAARGMRRATAWAAAIGAPVLNSLFVAAVLISVFMLARVAAMDSDHDGVWDARDRCPDTAQLRKVSADFKFAAAVNPDRLKPGARAYPVDRHGCELDTDGDGVVNSRDYCPDDSAEASSMGVAVNGCPKHSDADGTPDYRDRCPHTPAHVSTDRYGCATG